MRRRGMSADAIVHALLADNKIRCNPPLSENEVMQIAKSISRYQPAKDAVLDRNKTVTDNVTLPLSERIRDWVRGTNGWFSKDEMDKDLEIRNPEDKANRREIMSRLCNATPKILEHHTRDNKLYRYINTVTRLIDFKKADTSQIDVKYPFGLEYYFLTRPKNIIAIAGSPDAGKTAFLMNFVRMNMDNFPIYYQSSEMGENEFASRLKLFDDIALEDWNFTAEECSTLTQFVDSLRPDCINIFDYLEISDNFYMIADYFKQVYDKLGSGIALIALQKKRGADLGRGAEFALEKPRLYLSMDAGRIEIQKAKNWAQSDQNPNHLVARFKLVAGCKFFITQDWRKENEEEF